MKTIDYKLIIFLRFKSNSNKKSIYSKEIICCSKYKRRIKLECKFKKRENKKNKLLIDKLCI
jgi:hypothetical protein